MFSKHNFFASTFGPDNAACSNYFAKNLEMVFHTFLSLIVSCRKPFWWASPMLKTILRYKQYSEYWKANWTSLDFLFACLKFCVHIFDSVSKSLLSQLKMLEVHPIYPYLSMPQLMEESHLAERVAITESLSLNKLPTKTSGKKGVTLSLQEFQRGDTAGVCVCIFHHYYNSLWYEPQLSR